MVYNTAFRINVTDFGYAETDKLAFVNDLLLGVIGREELLGRLHRCTTVSKVVNDSTYKLKGVFVGVLDTDDKQNDEDVFIVPVSQTPDNPRLIVNALYSGIVETNTRPCEAVLRSSKAGSTLSLDSDTLRRRSRRSERRQTRSIEPGIVKKLAKKFNSQTTLESSRIIDNDYELVKKDCSFLTPKDVVENITTKEMKKGTNQEMSYALAKPGTDQKTNVCSPAPSVGISPETTDFEDEKWHPKLKGYNKLENFSMPLSCGLTQTDEGEVSSNEFRLGRVKHVPKVKEREPSLISEPVRTHLTIGRSSPFNQPAVKQESDSDDFRFFRQQTKSKNIQIGSRRRRKPQLEKSFVAETSKVCEISPTALGRHSPSPRCVDNISFPFSDSSSSSNEKLNNLDNRTANTFSRAPVHKDTGTFCSQRADTKPQILHRLHCFSGPHDLNFNDLKRENEVWRSLHRIASKPDKPNDFLDARQSSPPNQKEIEYKERVRKYSFNTSPMVQTQRKPLLKSLKSLKPFITAVHKLRTSGESDNERRELSRGTVRKAPKPSNGLKQRAITWKEKQPSSRQAYPNAVSVKSAHCCPPAMRSREWDICDFT